jgi:hypothetical protein
MFSPTTLAEAFQRNIWIIKRQTEGLSHEESLLQLPFRGNCMNWLVGHIAANRNNVFKLLGHADLVMPAAEARYTRESEPVTADEPGIVPLPELLAALESSQTQLDGILAEITRDELEREVAFFGRKVMTVGEWLHFFYFHDTYHTGQTEILRQAAGKDDKVI